MERKVASLALAVATLGLAACGGQKAAQGPAAGEQGGTFGQYYIVSVSRPVGGTIRSSDGRINCGTVGGGNDLCAPVSFGWKVEAEITAIPDPELYFQSWAADCDAPGPTCTLDTSNSGADKWVAAVFNPPERLGHGNYLSPSAHAPRFFAFLAGEPGAPRCTTCHGRDYAGMANAPSCTSCHAQSGHADWLTDCTFCHWYPTSTSRPATGAHSAHYGLSGPGAITGYGDLTTLQDAYPSAAPTEAPNAYAFGCGNCHPIDAGEHSLNGGSPAPKVVLYESSAPGGSLKGRNTATAAYDPATKTCSGAYCHSSGQQNPTFATTPAWDSGTHLACNGCHANPPRYGSGGVGTATANSHLQFSSDAASPWGHYAFVMTERRYTQHGRGIARDFLTGQTVYSDAAPITCQTCHFDTTDPSSTGPSGFYWLDTTGDYALLPNAWNYAYVCTACHSAASATAPVGQGRVLPLRHVNGSRDVQFDSRTGDPGASWVPAPSTPVRPYWFTQGSTTSAWWSSTNRNLVGTTSQFDLSPARYDPVQKTCTNVTCHMAQGNTSYTGTTPATRFEVLRWGAPYYVSTNDPATGRTTCTACHRNM